MTQTFEQTCDKPYDRHGYLLVLKSGQIFTYEDWESVQVAWFQNCRGKNLSHIIVVDNTPKKEKPKGF